MKKMLFKTSSSEKTKTRNVKYNAVAQWLRNMPEPTDTEAVTDNRSKKMAVENPVTFTNITINVENPSTSDIEQQNSDEPWCNESSLNACSTKPLRLHGSKCHMNEPNERSRNLDVRRVKFNIKSNHDDTDDTRDVMEKREKYDVIIRTAEEDNAELKRNMTKYLIESASRKDSRKQDAKNAHKYNVNADEVICNVEIGNSMRVTSSDGSESRSQISSVKELDVNKNALLATPPSHLPQHIQSSGYRSIRPAWVPGMTRRAPKYEFLRYKGGTQEIQTPVIKGLVVDVVDNQKPSVIRASKNANVREEYALRQKVDGYRASCNQSINKINFAQKRLNVNLQTLQNRLATRALPGDKNCDNSFYVKTLSEELFLQSKGYFPESSTRSMAYNFPPLTYPRRRILTVS